MTLKLPEFEPLSIRCVGQHPTAHFLEGDYAVFRGETELSDEFGYPYRGTKGEAEARLSQIKAKYGA